MRARVVLAVAMLAGAGCGSDPSAEPDPAGLDPAIFDQTVSAVSGDDVDLAAFADRDLVVWFWAPW